MANPAIIPIPPRVKDHTGSRFGRLVVLGYVGSDISGTRKRPRFFCQCDCGKTHTAQAVSLVSGMVKSCGCLAVENGRKNVHLANAACDRLGRDRFKTHGMSHQPEHNAWTGMKQRCSNPKNNRYQHYGARGIKVCERWRHSFENFLADMGPRPSSRHSLDRIDANGDYEPGNVRWATIEEQANNRTDNTFVTFEGKAVTLSEAEQLSGVSQKTLSRRLREGWPAERLFEPARK